MQKLVWNKSKCMKTNFYHDILQVVWVKLLLKIRACWRWWRSVLSSNFCDHCGWLGNICLYLPSHKSPDRGTRITFLCFNTFWKSLQQLRKWMEMFRHWPARKIVSHFEILLWWWWLPTNMGQIYHLITGHRLPRPGHSVSAHWGLDGLNKVNERMLEWDCGSGFLACFPLLKAQNGGIWPDTTKLVAPPIDDGGEV